MPVEPHSDPGSSSTNVAPLVATLLGFAIIAIPLAGLTWDLLRQQERELAAARVAGVRCAAQDVRDAAVGFPLPLAARVGLDTFHAVNCKLLLKPLEVS